MDKVERLISEIFVKRLLEGAYFTQMTLPFVILINCSGVN